MIFDKDWGWKQSDPEEFERYTQELHRLGRCLICQGYGQDWEKLGEDCTACHGSGKTSP